MVFQIIPDGAKYPSECIDKSILSAEQNVKKFLLSMLFCLSNNKGRQGMQQFQNCYL